MYTDETEENRKIMLPDDAGDPLDGPEPKENPLRARKVYSSSGHLTVGQKVYASNNVREERTRREDTVET